MALPETLSQLKPHSYGTAVCTQPIEFEHAAFAFGLEELSHIKIVGPDSLFDLVSQIKEGAVLTPRVRGDGDPAEAKPPNGTGAHTLLPVSNGCSNGADAQRPSGCAELEQAAPSTEHAYLNSSMSPLAAVSLSSADRHLVGIPVTAEYFAYVYPVAELVNT